MKVSFSSDREESVLREAVGVVGGQRCDGCTRVFMLCCYVVFAGPPSACENIQVTSTTDVTATISWNRPGTPGRSDLFYGVLHSDPNTIGQFILATDRVEDSGAVVAYTVSDLTPFTSYVFRVTTHNGVSDQDPNSHLRMCTTTPTTTAEGRRSQGNFSWHM